VNGGRPVVIGRGLRNLKLSARQAAAYAAAWALGEAEVLPSQRIAAQVFGASLPYLRAAMLLSPEQRLALMKGQNVPAFAALVSPTKLPLALPKPVTIDDADLVRLAREVGPDRLLSAAVEAERQIAA
jgi:hypothetical protein